MKVLLATILAALAAPAAALAAGPTLIVRDVPLQAAGRTVAAATPRFNMVAVHWQGAGAVQFRTRSSGDAWSAWQTADDDVAPDTQSSENRIRGWRLGTLAWTGSSDAIRFRTRGPVTKVRAYYIWSPTEATSSRRLAIANAPPIIPRLSWGADESIRRGKPTIAPAIHFAVVHHTAGSNDYTAAQSAAIVRGIELYHVQGNGWNDIGYNFLVDKYGQIFEGRYGGVDKAVVGAHSLGFNTGSVGVAVIGDYGSTPISAAAKTALEQLLAWRLDLAHIDPLSTLSWISGGNPRFPAGVPVILRAISGHRDTNYTDCPGNALYAQLPQIAKDVAALGAPKVYSPLVSGKLGGPIHFGAQFSSALPWTVTVADSTATVVAQGSGVGASASWTWDATSVPAQRYTWTIATAGALSASGTIGSGTVQLALQKATANPSLVAPGGDPSDDLTTVSYLLTQPATVTAAFVDGNGQVLSTLFSEALPAGEQSFTFTPATGLTIGTYTIQLAATASAGTTAAASVPFTIDDTLTGLVPSSTLFSAASHGAASLSFMLTRAATSVALQVLNGADVVATPMSGPLGVGPQTLTWDGTLGDGTIAPDGKYTLALTVTDAFTTFTKTTTVTLDSTPPTITVLSYPTMRFRISEPADLTLVVGTRRYTRTLTRPRTVVFWLKQKPKAYRLIASDPAGNVSVVRYRGG
jgi:flagellar hook assembly protein FlgD